MKREDFARKTNATVFEVYNISEEELTKMVEGFYTRYDRLGGKLTTEGLAHVLTLRKYFLIPHGEHPNKETDILLRVVKPSQLWTMCCAQKLAAELISGDLHYDYRRHEVSRKDLCYRAKLPALEFS